MPGLQVERFDAEEKGAEIKRVLEKNGFSVFISDYGRGQPMREPLNVYVEQVKKEMKLIRPDFAVAHSAAGLILRKIIETSPKDLGIKILIMLETPNLGTTLKRVRMSGFPEDWPSVQDMRRGSNFLRELNEDWLKKRKKLKTRYFQIGGVHTIRFPEIFKLPDVETFEFKVGHSELRTDIQVIRKIIEILT